MTQEEEIITANLVLPIVKDLLLPKLTRIFEKFSIKGVEKDDISSNIEDYLINRYHKYLIIDTLAFPNKQTLFKSLYEPLTIVTQVRDKKEKEIQINSFEKNFLPKYVRAIIEDTAGMGKSTITRKLFLSAIEEKAGIPILIELRQINSQNDFLTEVQSQLSPLGHSIPIKNLIHLINEGEFIFLFDGFDEISKVDKKFVIQDLHKFIEKAGDNYFLITSRKEDSLVSFGDFQKFHVRPLLENEAHSLIQRYDKYSFKPISKELISQLKEKVSDELKEYLKNPFLVSLLYKSFDHKKDIPLKKTQFYRQVYDALFEAHDLSKEGYLKRDKHSNLHLDDFEKVLRHVGYFTSIENKVEYEKDYIINIIEKAKKYVPELNFNASDYLNDLLETVPLFKQDGNLIKWAHKSLQDYFTAKFLWIDSKQNQTKILRKIYDDKENARFYNVLDLFYEFDPGLFEETLLFWLLSDFKEYCNENFAHFKDINSKFVKNRLENTFSKNCVIAITKEEDYMHIIDSRETSRDVIAVYQKQVSKEFVACPINFNYYKEPQIIAFTFFKIIPNLTTILKVASTRIPQVSSHKSHKVQLDQKLTVLKQGKVYPIDFKSENIINRKSIFALVNDLLLSDYTIDYDGAMEKHGQILKNKKQKMDINELTDW